MALSGYFRQKKLRIHMPSIESIVLRTTNPEAQRKFYCEVLGMQRVGDDSVGYNKAEAKLTFVQSTGAYCPRPNDRYWKIALAVPDIELAHRQLTEFEIKVSEPQQFLDIGYLAHFNDPEGFTIELINHEFKGEQYEFRAEGTLLGGGAHLNLLTLRTHTIDRARQQCLDWGMKPLSIQPVEGRNFTLYFFAFTDEDPPNSDNLQAIENRPWVYQRPYTVLELQHLHDAKVIAAGNPKLGGYSGFTITNNMTESRLITAATDL
jgi:predicted enzyme related to lactoylglutathione lyase